MAAEHALSTMTPLQRALLLGATPEELRARLPAWPPAPPAVGGFEGQQQTCVVRILDQDVTVTRTWVNGAWVHTYSDNLPPMSDAAYHDIIHRTTRAEHGRRHREQTGKELPPYASSMRIAGKVVSTINAADVTSFGTTCPIQPSI